MERPGARGDRQCELWYVCFVRSYRYSYIFEYIGDFAARGAYIVKFESSPSASIHRRELHIPLSGECHDMRSIRPSGGISPATQKCNLLRSHAHQHKKLAILQAHLGVTFKTLVHCRFRIINNRQERHFFLWVESPWLEYGLPWKGRLSDSRDIVTKNRF
jgi:hypothetical protein